MLSPVVLGLVVCAGGQDVTVRVDAAHPAHALSPWLTGACIEDVNHEIYGGLYSQMLFGESFQEPSSLSPVKGFRVLGGQWSLHGDEVHGRGSDGPKLVSQLPAFGDGQVDVQVLLTDRAAGNVGLIVHCDRPGVGADQFSGYEVALDAERQMVRLGRHEFNYRLLADVPCELPIGRWIGLRVSITGAVVEVAVDGRAVLRHDEGARALPPGTVALRPWQREGRWRHLRVTTGGQTQAVAFEPSGSSDQAVSAMWRPVQHGTSAGRSGLVNEQPFVGAQSQRLEFVSGQGEWGIENQGLNRCGLHLVAGRPYELVVWARSERQTELTAALETADGAARVAEARLTLLAGDWQRLTASLTPNALASPGRLALTLTQPGAVTLGYACLQPGEWGRFKSLPVRRDVAEALIDQGITVLRYGGSMVNVPGYRWKQMIGPRERRQPYRGMWYPYSTNGWGIVDFLAFCRAAGFAAIPAFHMGESPADLADFVEYINGPATSPWGARRAADGYGAPFGLKYLQLGNEERVDEAYAAAFEERAKAIWAKDPNLILVVGDFVYSHPIGDPQRVTGAMSKITDLNGHRRILQCAKAHQREVWFDIHLGTDGPQPDSTLPTLFTYIDALHQLADGARHQVVVFELNANNPTQRRAVANALALLAAQRDGRLPMVTSANCLQVDQQNDNGWNQGLLFLNPSQVWLSPPGWVTRLFAGAWLPQAVPVHVSGAEHVAAAACRSEDGRALSLQLVNAAPEPATVVLALDGFTPAGPAEVQELAARLDAVNTAAQPRAVVPQTRAWPGGPLTLAPWSVTVLRWR